MTKPTDEQIRANIKKLEYVLDIGDVQSAAAWFANYGQDTLAVLEDALNPWQPIETAPKDETKVLISNGVWVVTAKYGLSSNCDNWDEGKVSWWDCLEEECDDSWYNTEFEPTHWMPLPNPPSVACEDEEQRDTPKEDE